MRTLAHKLHKHTRTAAKHLKRVHHRLTKKKVVKKRTARHIARGVFVTIAAVCTGSMAFAIATTKPVVNLELQTNFKPHTIVSDVAQASQNPGGPDQVGEASWYALGLPAPDSQTCASTTFPRGTYLQVTNKRNGRQVVCLVNDYGPEAWTHRVIDLSRGSFRVIDSLGSGTTQVEIRVVKPPAPRPQGFNFSFKSVVGWFSSRFTGYSLCQLRHTRQFCDQNRQKTWTF